MNFVDELVSPCQEQDIPCHRFLLRMALEQIEKKRGSVDAIASEEGQRNVLQKRFFQLRVVMPR